MPCVMGMCLGQSDGPGLTRKIGDALAAIGRAAGRLFSRRVTEADRWLALDADWHTLGDHTLRDIGLSRTEIPYVEAPRTDAPDRPA